MAGHEHLERAVETGRGAGESGEHGAGRKAVARARLWRQGQRRRPDECQAPTKLIELEAAQNLQAASLRE